MTTQTIEAALALDEDQRAELAYRLLQSLRPPDVPSAENDDFGAELDRRMDSYEAGETTARSWDESSRRILEALDDRNGLYEGGLFDDDR